MPEQLAIGTDGAAFGAGRSEWAGKAAFWVVGTADKCATRSGCAHGQTPITTAFADAWINPGLFHGKEMRLKDIVNLFKNFSDGLIHRLVNRDLEVLPETAQNRAVFAITGRNVIQFIFQISRELIADVLAEETAQENSHQTPLILRNQTVLLFAHIVAILDCGDDRGIGGGATNAQLFHTLDQAGLGVARWWLGMMLLRGDRFFSQGIGGADLWQTLVIFVNNRVVTPFLIDPHEAIKEHHLPGGAQTDLPIA